MKSVLFIMQIPPPVHGASVTGENIKKSSVVNAKFNCSFIRISTVTERGGLIRRLGSIFSLYFKVVRTLTSNKFDLVYLTPCSSGFLPFYKDLGLCLISKVFCRKVLYHFHDKGISTNRYAPSFILKVYFNRVKVILSSKALYYDIEKYVQPGDVYYCAYGIYNKNSLADFGPRANNKFTILFLAHMLRTKGVFDLLAACKILNDQGVDFECKFVGSWHDIKEAEFFQFVKDNGLEQKVRFLGPQYGQDKDKALSQSDVLCLPTFYPMECFPLIILDAMRWKLPVISTAEGAIPEIIDNGVSGFVINKNAPGELAEKLTYLLHHENARKKMGEAGRAKFIDKYTQSIFEDTLCQILEKV